MSSPSPHNSSSDSIFDESVKSRSISPSSEPDSSPIDNTFEFNGRSLVTFVYLPSTTIEPDVVRSIFSKYSSKGGCLGLCLPNNKSYQCPPPFTEWTKESMFHNGRGRALYLFVSVQEVSLPKGDKVVVIHSQIPETQAEHHLSSFSLANLRALISISLANNYTLHILEKPSFVFPSLSRTPGFSLTFKQAKGNIPTLEEWEAVWSAWDLVTLQMIPQDMLHQKPINLRHKCLFYIGHIPTFLDMLLSKSIGGEASEPQYFWNIFERGIDPHVDDPDHCHRHSEVPTNDEDWPSLSTIIQFRNRVRTRLRTLYADLKSGKRRLTQNIARTLVMTLEHEGFHIETLLYMLIQRAGTGTLPPPGFTPPTWDILTSQWNTTPFPSSSTVIIGPAVVSLGHQDSECLDDSNDEDYEGETAASKAVEDHVYGWDNESPQRTYQVGAFRAEWRPVSNCEFEAYWRNKNGEDWTKLPTSWVVDNGSQDIKVRTMYGPVSMEIAQHWPVLTSYDDLLAYAESKGGRLPTEPELRLFYDMYEVGHEGGSNTGFRNWHPVPATTGLDVYQGKGSNGGVWEWTSTRFDTHEGLHPTNLFTGYSTDFFDTKHHVVLGASYATIPRLASRRTVRNFYQHNYPYAWVGGRVVYDA